MNRNDFIKTLLAGILIPSTNQLLKGNTIEELKTLPILFLSTGSPMNLLESNHYSDFLTEYGLKINIPKNILVISSNWYIESTEVTSNVNLEIMHEYLNMNDEYYNEKYKTIGNPEFAQLIINKTTDSKVYSNFERGIDSGAWMVCKKLFPKGEIPITQLSINNRMTAYQHYKLAKQLSQIRSQDTLIICTGNIVYNPKYMHAVRDAAPFEWAQNFDDYIKDAIYSNNIDKLINFRNENPYAKNSVVFIQQYLPLIYALGLKKSNEKVSFIYEGFQNSSISLRSFIVE